MHVQRTYSVCTHLFGIITYHKATLCPTFPEKPAVSESCQEFKSARRIFSAECIMYDAASVLRSSSFCMIIAGALTFIACSIIAAPYGRYNTAKGWGFLVPAKLSWFLMESPNLWMPPLVYGYIGSADRFNSRPNMFLLGMFLLHYFHRSIIYPIFRVDGRRHEPTPLSVTLLAFCYCSWNSYNQAVALLVVTEYP